jgi:predicted amidophosphoribosyltransferase
MKNKGTKDNQNYPICSYCEEHFDPDQYIAWCNRCGNRQERSFMKEKQWLSDSGYQDENEE